MAATLLVGMETWSECMRLGMQQMRGGESHAAILYFERAAALRPGHATARFNLAAALLRSGEHEPALHVYDHLLADRPDHAALHHGRGLTLNALGERASALAAFRTAVSRDEDAWQSWGSIADITSDELERQEAVRCAAEALERLCCKPEVPASLHVECANALINAHRYADAVAFISRRISRFPNASAAYNSLARAAYRRGTFKDAFCYQREALFSLDPKAMPGEPLPNPFKPNAAIEAACDVIQILEAHGLAPFLVAGTLLGFHRDGGPLSHDRDVDIGVMRQADDKQDVVAIVREHPTLLLRHDHQPGARYIALIHRGVGIDLFVHDRIGDHIFCGMTDRPGDTQWRFKVFGLDQRDYGGIRWRIPDAPERYLAETYGPRWQFPDPGFASAISSPALYEVDPHVRAYYALTRARQSLLFGDRAKARALLRQSPIPVDDDIERAPCLNAYI
ncbi:tetratricopeptide repeat protein [Xanthomonas campestris pv. phormiicola]|nr:tetratricopeptide repeat protein [Xanthomonas campestris pv. phormiicola]UYC17399.1 tetratricopeptide repeat protein [Xanthomonas campestris pv. phormiicola]